MGNGVNRRGRRPGGRGRLAVCLIMCMAGLPVHADIFKCIGKGRTVTYQERPCDTGDQSKRLDNGGDADLTGCFTQDGTTSFNMRIRATGLGEYVLEDWGKPSAETHLPLVRATSADLKVVGDGFHVQVLQGLKVKDFKDPRPIGVYVIRTAQGSEAFFGFFFLENGLMQKTACPRSP